VSCRSVGGPPPAGATYESFGVVEYKPGLFVVKYDLLRC